jgi:hypothetical protein
MKKILATILALVLALGLCTTSWAADCTHDDNCTVHMVKIGDTHYDTMAAAATAVHEKTGEDRMAGTTIVLLHDATGSGFGVGYNTIENNATKGNNPVSITIDLNGKTYTMCAPTVGSSGTETNGFQFLKGSTVVIKNGNIVLPDGVRCAYLFQNYANLTLQDVNVDIEKCEPCEAAIHSMNGVVKIVGSTSIAASGNYKWSESDAGVRKSVALLDWGKRYTDGTQVTVETTGTLTGVVQSTRYEDVPTNKSKLTIKSGNFDGEFMREDENSPEILIESGSFTDKDVMEFTSKTEENTTPVASNNGTYYVGETTIQSAANSLPGGQQMKIEQGKVTINNVAYGQGSTYTKPSSGGYYYYPSTSDTTTSTTTKGSPKTFDAGIGIYAVTAVLSVTGMAWTAKKRH